MAHLMDAKNPELIIRETDPERILRSAREEPNPSVQEQMPKNDKHFFVAGHMEAGCCLEPRPRKKSTVQKADLAHKSQLRRILSSPK